MCKSRGVFLVFARFILLCLFFASFAPLEMARADIADDAGKLIYREENHVFVRDCGYEPISRSCAGGTTQSVDLVAYNKATHKSAY